MELIIQWGLRLFFKFHFLYTIKLALTDPAPDLSTAGFIFFCAPCECNAAVFVMDDARGGDLCGAFL
jgi:hypothetical protein